MATNVFDLFARLSLDSSEFEKGLNSAKSMAGTIGSSVATAAKVGLKAVTAATGATVAFGKSAINAGQDFDKSMSQVAATMGLNIEEMTKQTGTAMLSEDGQMKQFTGNLRDFAQELGRTTQYSATEAADALNYMALAGYSVQESMDMLPNVLNLAAAGNFDLARASDMVTDTQTAFGIDAKRTTQMVDEMAKAASTGNTSVEQLGDAFLVVGGLAQELNGGMVELKDGSQASVDGIQELEIALTAMANAGVKGSEAGTHMRNMLLKLSSPTDAGTMALENMGVKVFDTEGKMRSLSDVFGDLSTAMKTMTQEERIMTISDLFNTRDMASAEALLNAVSQDWDKIGESILNAEGAAQKMKETQMDNLAGDVKYFESALEGARIAVSDKLTPTLRDFVKFGTEGLSELTDAFKKGGIDSAVEAFGKILADGLSMLIKKLPSFIDAGIKVLSAFGQGLINNLPMIIKAGNEIIDKLAKALSGGNLTKIMQAVSKLISGLLAGIKKNLPNIKPLITEYIKDIAHIIATNAGDFVDIAIEIATAIADGLVQSIPILLEKAPEIIDALVDGFVKNPQAFLILGPKIIGFISTGIKGAKSLLTPVGKLLSGEIGAGIKTGGASLNTSMGSVIGNLAIYTAAALAGAEIGKKMGEAIFPSDAELYEQYEGIMGTVRLLADSIKAEIDLVGIFNEKARQAKREYGEGGLLEGLTDENYKTVISTVDNWVSVNGDLAHSLEDLTRRFNDGTLNAEYYRSSIASLIEGSEQFKGASDLTQKAIRDWMDVEWVDYFKNHFADAEDTVVNVATATEKASTSCTAYEEAARKGANALQGLYDANVSAVSSNEELEGSISEVDLTLEEFIEKITTEDWVSDWNYIKEGFDTTWALMQDSLTNAWQDVKDAFNFEEAITWGEDLINNFISGIQSKMGELETTVKGIAQTTKKYIGFSEPEEGPLSNFHTYAPDMMKLFAKGIRDNKHLVTDEFDELNFNSSTKNGVLNLGNGTPNLVNNSRGQQNMTVILELDKTELGRVVYNLNNAENQRMGVQLAGGVL